MSSWFYILRLRSGAPYPGATKNLGERYKAHLAGKACRTTQSDPPIAIVHSEEFQTFREARRREAQITKWSRQKKEAFGQALRLDPSLSSRISNPGRIIAFRNRLIHGYASIADEIVWGILEANLPTLQKGVATLMIELNKG